MVWQGGAWSGWNWRDKIGRVEIRQDVPGLGKIRRGMVRNGATSLGMVRIGMAWRINFKPKE